MFGSEKEFVIIEAETHGPGCSELKLKSSAKTHRLSRRPIKDLLIRYLFPQEKRISVDDALMHPYINVWYDESEVNAVSIVLYVMLFTYPN